MEFSPIYRDVSNGHAMIGALLCQTSYSFFRIIVGVCVQPTIHIGHFIKMCGLLLSPFDIDTTVIPPN